MLSICNVFRVHHNKHVGMQTFANEHQTAEADGNLIRFAGIWSLTKISRLSSKEKQQHRPFQKRHVYFQVTKLSRGHGRWLFVSYQQSTIRP